MILPIVAYGNPVLRKVAQDIEKDYPALPKMIEDMWETLYASSGVGLAAPQINKSIRLFVVDSEQIFRQLEEDKEKHSYPDAPGIKQVFINAHIKELDGFEWSYNEGCLSIPKVREDIKRQSVVTIEYLDEEFQHHMRTYKGLTARIISSIVDVTLSLIDSPLRIWANRSCPQNVTVISILGCQY